MLKYICCPFRLLDKLSRNPLRGAGYLKIRPRELGWAVISGPQPPIMKKCLSYIPGNLFLNLSDVMPYSRYSGSK